MPIWQDLISAIAYATVHDLHSVAIYFQEDCLMMQIQDLAIMEILPNELSRMNRVQGGDSPIGLHHILPIGHLKIILNQHIHQRLDHGVISTSAFIGVMRIGDSLNLQLSTSRSSISID